MESAPKLSGEVAAVGADASGELRDGNPVDRIGENLPRGKNLDRQLVFGSGDRILQGSQESI